MNKKKKILFKVEGSEKIGMGHVFRSFFLIQKLKKIYDVIVFTEKNTKCENFFKKKKLKFISYKKIHQFKALKKIFNDLQISRFINDSIYFDKKITQFLKTKNCKCFFLDTKNIKPTDNFYCINTFMQNKQNHKNYYHGLKYVITDPSLKFSKKNKPYGGINLIIHFGGTDEKKFNIKIINILSQLKNLQKVSIILGPALNYESIKINEIIRKNKLKIKIYRYPKKLNDIYNCHNLAITAGGNTMFNFCAINLKNISISTNNMEIKNCKKMKKMNLTNYYDHYSNFNEKKFIKFFNKVILQKHIVKKKSLFNGVNEISKIITKSENSI